MSHVSNKMQQQHVTDISCATTFLTYYTVMYVQATGLRASSTGVGKLTSAVKLQLTVDKSILLTKQAT
jgi:hypothetical protein